MKQQQQHIKNTVVALTILASYMLVMMVNLSTQQDNQLDQVATSLFSSTSYFSKLVPNVLKDRKRTLSSQRSRRLDEISQLATSYLEMEEMLHIEQSLASSSEINSRKTKMYNLASLITKLTNEVQMIDKWCEKRVGPNCDVLTCFGKWEMSQEAPCSGKGKCMDIDTCVCDDGYTGMDCGDYSCYGVFNSNATSKPCSGNGICIAPNKCQCKDGFFGNNCELSNFQSAIVMQPNMVRQLDQTYIPTSCLEYLKNFYTGSVGNGFYLVQPKDRAYTVYCDMESGGWTLINGIVALNQTDGSSTPSLSEDLTSYSRISLTQVTSSSILKEFKFTNVKSNIGTSCVTDSDNFISEDKILSKLCQPSFQNLIGSSIETPFSTSLKYWFK